MPTFDATFWEALWTKTLREHGDKLGRRPPNAHLLSEVSALQPGRAVDAGCGHGAETLWLAARGWTVTAVDFSSAALQQARLMAEALGHELAARIDFVQADLATWAPPLASAELVVSLYVHVAGDVVEAVGRLARGVAPGGTLLLVGHQGPHGQTQVSLAAARAALASADWQLVVAEERPRSAGGGVDAVIVARRAQTSIGGA